MRGVFISKKRKAPLGASLHNVLDNFLAVVLYYKKEENISSLEIKDMKDLKILEVELNRFVEKILIVPKNNKMLI